MAANRVLVFGDAVLDSYLYGTAVRVSPEAPVPVLSATGREYRLGGAANVAANIAALGGKAHPLFALADDARANIMREMLKEHGIDLSGCVALHGAETIVKERVVASAQQIVRIDYHDSVDLDELAQDEIEASFKRMISDVDIVVISDYGKGSCTTRLCERIIELAAEIGLPVIVDPKGVDWAKYSGATVITPNLKEMCGMARPSKMITIRLSMHSRKPLWRSECPTCY